MVRSDYEDRVSTQIFSAVAYAESVLTAWTQEQRNNSSAGAKCARQGGCSQQQRSSQEWCGVSWWKDKKQFQP